MSEHDEASARFAAAKAKAAAARFWAMMPAAPGDSPPPQRGRSTPQSASRGRSSTYSRSSTPPPARSRSPAERLRLRERVGTPSRSPPARRPFRSPSARRLPPNRLRSPSAAPRARAATRSPSQPSRSRTPLRTASPRTTLPSPSATPRPSARPAEARDEEPAGVWRESDGEHDDDDDEDDGDISRLQEELRAAIGGEEEGLEGCGDEDEYDPETFEALHSAMAEFKQERAGAYTSSDPYPSQEELAAGHRTHYSEAARRAMVAERAAAKSSGMQGWDGMRGPLGPNEGGPAKWRGQTYRPGSARWANRGGRNREYYAWKYGGRPHAKSTSASSSSRHL